MKVWRRLATFGPWFLFGASAATLVYFFGAMFTTLMAVVVFLMLKLVADEGSFQTLKLRGLENDKKNSKDWVYPSALHFVNPDLIKLPENFSQYYEKYVRNKTPSEMSGVDCLRAMDRHSTLKYILEIRKTGNIDQEKLFGLLTANTAYHGNRLPKWVVRYNEFAERLFIDALHGGGRVTLDQYLTWCVGWADEIKFHYTADNEITRRGLINKEWVYQLKTVVDRAARWVSGNGNASANPSAYLDFYQRVKSEPDLCIFHGFSNPDEITEEDYKTTMTIVFFETLGYVPLSYLSFSPVAQKAAGAINRLRISE